jgi:methionyl-tRNA synthetase
MSKSVGNVINPLDLIKEYGVDPVRYYLMREMVLGQDANFTRDSFIKRYNSDLANDFGNLLNRISTLIQKNYGGIIPHSGELTLDEKNIKAAAVKLVSEMDGKIMNMKINEALEDIMQFIRRINKYMEEQAPWKMVKKNKDAAGRILYIAGESLRISASLLSPVMPNRTSILFEALNAEESTEWGCLKSGNKIRDHQPLFPRIQI